MTVRIKGNRKCELNCQATGYRFYVRQAEKVIDGTPCDQNGTAICVSGQCKKYLNLGSNLVLFIFDARTVYHSESAQVFT
ncbi:ADAMTS-like protein 4 [Cricetulus griseus]|uniref:ADAMTS-like protein 4 n=1 Tax=Cricetulus griseus TaxID=10029 RepID=A0A061I513_CRIGR|nr:ADAMTS-like protein 4 [Cricetulus griseus]